MKGTKFFGIGIALAACVLVLLLAAEAGFVSVALAGKPRKYRTEYGYAMFRDGDGDVIKSDGRGQYVDCTKGGEDFVEFQIYNDDNSLRGVLAYFGKMTYHHPTYPPSPRRVNFHFNIHGGATTPEYEDNKAVYDILRWYREGTTYTERSSLNPGFLDDNSVHAPIYIYTAGSDRVQFVVDPGYAGTDPKAITQASVDAFYDDDKNVSYWDTSEHGEAGQIIYSLYYGDNGFDVVPVAWEVGTNNPITWIVTANLVKVTLGVGRSAGRGQGHRIVYLAEYSALPFQFAVSLQPLTAYPEIPGAPRKHNTLSTTWGKIKVK